MKRIYANTFLPSGALNDVRRGRPRGQSPNNMQPCVRPEKFSGAKVTLQRRPKTVPS